MLLMQRYGLLSQIPRKTMISSCSCCDNGTDFGQSDQTALFIVATGRETVTIAYYSFIFFLQVWHIIGIICTFAPS